LTLAIRTQVVEVEINASESLTKAGHGNR